MAKAPKLTRQQIKDGLNTLPMDGLLLGSAAKHIGAGLTPKQREFARLVALGESKAGAYRQAYKSKGNTKTQAANGYKVSRSADMQHTIEAFAEAQRFAESHTPAQLRAFVIQQLAYHAQNAEKDSDRIRATQLLGTVAEISAFQNVSVVQHVKSSGDIRERIAEKLKLIGASTTIEAEQVQDAEQDAESLMAELNGQDETHTIDAGAINSDGVIPDYGSESGFSHADDILEGGGVESAEDVPTPPGAPRNWGVDDGIGVHSIPHNQSPEIPHNQSARFPDQHNASSDDSGTQPLEFPSDISSDVSSLSALPTASELDALKKELAGGEVIHNLTCTLTGDISKS